MASNGRIPWLVRSCLFTLIAATAAPAATPPALVNYQGVLRSATDQPLTGSYDIVFHLYDAAAGGAEIMFDRHLTVNAQAVQVSGGLFSAQIGSGELLDGGGAGTYTALDSVFRDFGAVWLGIQIGAETLTPRTRIAAAGYALNASNLGGKAAGSFLDTSSSSQSKLGPLYVYASASFSTGITATGDYAAGQFVNIDNSATAILGNSGIGVIGSGTSEGGYFLAPGGGHAYVGTGLEGIDAYGTIGGSFHSTGNSGEAHAGYYDTGVYASGSSAGAYFFASGSSSYAVLATPTDGILARGALYAGRFVNSGGSGDVLISTGNSGIVATGEPAGTFNETSTGTGRATLALYDVGVSGHGAVRGGYFADVNGSGLAFVAEGDRGIWGKGSFAGGTFSHPNDVTFWADVATPTKKIQGTGAVSFVQNHPDAPDRVVVYTAPEGDEVAVYTRGVARLVDGEAHVKLGETFAMVANPDLGLTVHVSATDEPVPLAATTSGTREIIVRGPAGSSATFDYLVFGLRIGFERSAVIQKKERAAFLPEAAAFDAVRADDPIREHDSALARFTAMRDALGEPAADLTNARNLQLRINSGREDALAAATAAAEARRSAELAPVPNRPPADAPAERPIPAIDDRRPVAVPTAPFVMAPVSGRVAEGDVLTLDVEAPGAVRASAVAHDRGVAGCVLGGAPGVIVPAGQVALGASGIVACRVDASYGPVVTGDLLTTSPTPGHAMVAGPDAAGAILGKAMEPLREGTALIRVLVSFR